MVGDVTINVVSAKLWGTIPIQQCVSHIVAGVLTDLRPGSLLNDCVQNWL